MVLRSPSEVEEDSTGGEAISSPRFDLPPCANEASPKHSELQTRIYGRQIISQSGESRPFDGATAIMIYVALECVAARQ